MGTNTPHTSLEPGLSRARYFPRDMLLLTTTARERAWRLLKITGPLIGWSDGDSPNPGVSPWFAQLSWCTQYIVEVKRTSKQLFLRLRNSKKLPLWFVMVLCTRQKVPTISIIINGSEIKQVRVQKHLGLNIDERLAWTDHVSTIVNRLPQDSACYAGCDPVYHLWLSKLSSALVFFLFWSTHSLAWSGLGTINAERLAIERLQRTAARLITGTRLVENVPRESCWLELVWTSWLTVGKLNVVSLRSNWPSERIATVCLVMFLKLLKPGSAWPQIGSPPWTLVRSPVRLPSAYLGLEPTLWNPPPSIFVSSVLNSVPPDNLKSEASVKEYLLSCQWFNLHVHSILLIVPILSCLFLLSSFTLALAIGCSNE